MKIIVVDNNYNKDKFTDEGTRNNIQIVLKPDSALLKGNKPFFIPDFTNHLIVSPHIVVRVCRLGKNIAKRFAHRYYDGVTIGFELTAKDVVDKLKADGMDSHIGRNFDSSAAVGEFICLDEEERMGHVVMTMKSSSGEKTEVDSEYLRNSVEEIIEYVSKYCTLKIGDLIFIGTPSNGQAKAEIDKSFTGFAGDRKLLELHIK
ncbi:MAG: fumarylacetoacetate hydrolase family protein [Bacteroides sp.]|nr:fumarylacetoacetate hydrolase family protein [Bacteroides sp.]